MVIPPKLLLDVLLVRQRKESPMDHGQLSMVADTFQWVFSEGLLNACGKDAKCCRRQRTMTPFRLGLALTATCASQRVETLADFGKFHNQQKVNNSCVGQTWALRHTAPHVAVLI